MTGWAREVTRALADDGTGRTVAEFALVLGAGLVLLGALGAVRAVDALRDALPGPREHRPRSPMNKQVK